MRNIWGWVVGVVLVGGVVVSLVRLFGDDVPDEPRRARVVAPVAAPTEQAAPKQEAAKATPTPTPDATFGEVKITATITCSASPTRRLPSSNMPPSPAPSAHGSMAMCCRP